MQIVIAHSSLIMQRRTCSTMDTPTTSEEKNDSTDQGGIVEAECWIEEEPFTNEEYFAAVLASTRRNVEQARATKESHSFFSPTGRGFFGRLGRFFRKDLNILRKKGSVVWACIVQANVHLFDPRHNCDRPAAIIYSMDPYFDARVDELQLISHKTLVASRATTEVKTTSSVD